MPDDLCPICGLDLIAIWGRMYCEQCHRDCESGSDAGETSVGGSRADPDSV